jgi:DNA-binding SARP family transcriptional activator
MEFKILGPLEVSDEGRVLEFAGSRQRQLLAILVLHANEVVSAGRLIDQLWGAEPPATAAKSLQVYVSRLRKALGREDLLLTRSGGYTLAIGRDDLDLARFERLAERGRERLAVGDLDAAAADLNDALRLWRGPPLADFAYDAFAITEITRLEELRLACLEERIDADLARGHHSELSAELESLVAAHPLRERLRGQLMLALYRSGRQAEALEAYQQARHVLVDELGIEPGRTLRKLEQAILRQDSSLEPQARSSLADDEGFRPGNHGIFVGRETELAELVGGVKDAIAGQARLFLLVGEAGIGKSRLAEEAAARATAVGARVLWGRCWEAGGAPAYWPWVQSLRSYVSGCDPGQLRGLIRGNAVHVAQLVPEIAELLPELGEPQPLDGDGARFQLFDATATFLARVGAQRPLVLVLDDLHAADEPSLLLLRFVASNVPDARLMIIGAYREDELQGNATLSERLSDLVRRGRRLSLTGLGAQEVGSFIELASGSRPSEALVSALYEESEGNPLFVGELVQLAAANGERRNERQAQNRGTVPTGIRDVIDRRLRNLSPECRRLLTGGSIFGREFRLGALSRLLELERAVLLDAVDEAIAAGIVTELAGTPARLRFAHGLIRDTVYDELSGAQRALLHRRTGEVLAELYTDDQEPHLAELARHFLAGDEVERAVDYARRAGDQALRLLAYEEAARLYQAALEALGAGELQSGEERCELMLALGDAQARAGDMPGARETFVVAAELARRLGAGEYLARAALGYGGRFVWLRAGRDRRIVPLLEDALALLPNEDSSLRVRVLARLAGALRDLPSPKRRVNLCREAVAIARRLADPATLAYALDGMAALAPPDADAWFELATETVTIAQAADDRERLFNGRTSRAGAAMSLGDIAKADAEIQAMAELADELRQPAQRWMTTVFLAMRALFDGRHQEAENLIPEALSLGETAEAWDASTVSQIQLYALRREQARLDELDEMIHRSVPELPARPLFRCMLADVHVALGRTTEARETFDALAERDFALIPVETEWATSISILAETCAFLGDSARAEMLYDLLVPYADTNIFNHPEVSRGATARYLAILAATAGRWTEAESHFDQALNLNTQMGTRPWLAWTQHDYAQMLIASGKPARRASDFAAAAAATAHELGMTRLSSEIAARARMATER